MAITDTFANLGTAIINFVNRKIVTSISASSTDTSVPSAKCVYDAIQAGGGGSNVEASTAEEVQTSRGTI